MYLSHNMHTLKHFWPWTTVKELLTIAGALEASTKKVTVEGQRPESGRQYEMSPKVVCRGDVIS